MSTEHIRLSHAAKSEPAEADSLRRDDPAHSKKFSDFHNAQVARHPKQEEKQHKPLASRLGKDLHGPDTSKSDADRASLDTDSLRTEDSDPQGDSDDKDLEKAPHEEAQEHAPDPASSAELAVHRQHDSHSHQHGHGQEQYRHPKPIDSRKTDANLKELMTASENLQPEKTPKSFVDNPSPSSKLSTEKPERAESSSPGDTRDKTLQNAEAPQQGSAGSQPQVAVSNVGSRKGESPEEIDDKDKNKDSNKDPTGIAQSILDSWSAQATPPVQNSSESASPEEHSRDKLVEQVNSCLEKLAVSGSAGPHDSQHVMMQISQDILPDTQIQIQKNEQGIDILIKTGSTVTENQLRASDITQLAQSIRSQLPASQNVNVRFEGPNHQGESGNDSRQRSKGYTAYNDLAE